VTVLEEAEGGGQGCLEYGSPLQLPFGDEGRAMMQIIHDVAPGAALAFYTAVDSEADFANGIEALAASVASGGAGAKVIADDVGYPDEPFFQDGILAQAIDTVEANGVAYFSAAGNDGTLGYDNLSPTFATAGSGVTAGEHLLNWDTSAATTTTTLPVTIPSMIPGQFVSIVLEWDQPYVTGAPTSGGATSQLNLCVENVTGNDLITDDDLNTLSSGCTGTNALGNDPVQVLIVANPANSAGNSEQATLNVVVGLASGAAPGRIKLAVEDDGLGSTINQFATNSGTLQGHPGAAGAMAVAAAFYFQTPACGSAPAVLETYSSEGGTPILFDVTGTRLATPQTRQKPNIVGPDGGNTTFFGFTLASQGLKGGQLNTTNASCQNNASYPNFFGTSAATPHVAGIAALFLQANASLTPTQIYTALQDGALSMNGTTSPDDLTGYGFVQANTAATLIPAVAPVAPTLTMASPSIVAGASTTLTWSSANTTGCTASGSWSGALASSGTQTVTPSAAGSDTYSLACANAAGTSPTTSVTLMVTAAAAATSSHGGGAIGVPTLLGLAAIRLMRRRRRL
jgi:subtilisin family serine protease